MTGDRVWIGRSDHTFSNRTISVKFDQVPGSTVGATQPPVQKIEALLDALICPQAGLSGSLSSLGITVALNATTQFNGESCADLEGLLASGMSPLVDVEILEDGAGGLTATDVDLAGGGQHRRRRNAQGRH